VDTCQLRKDDHREWEREAVGGGPPKESDYNRVPPERVFGPLLGRPFAMIQRCRRHRGLSTPPVTKPGSGVMVVMSALLVAGQGRARCGSTSDRTGTGLLQQAPTRSLRRSSCQVDSRPADESARGNLTAPVTIGVRPGGRTTAIQHPCHYSRSLAVPTRASDSLAWGGRALMMSIRSGERLLSSGWLLTPGGRGGSRSSPGGMSACVIRFVRFRVR
jgi:hypothetical protein